MIKQTTDFSQVDRFFARAEIAQDKALREVSINAIALISNRIQNRGLTTEGKPINGGEYSKGHKRVRTAAGRRVDKVNLTFSGDMLDRGFQARKVARGWGIGLAGSKTSKAGRTISHVQLMEHFEKTNGPIIQPSARSQELLNQVLIDRLTAELR